MLPELGVPSAEKNTSILKRVRCGSNPSDKLRPSCTSPEPNILSPPVKDSALSHKTPPEYLARLVAWVDSKESLAAEHCCRCQQFAQRYIHGTSLSYQDTVWLRLKNCTGHPGSDRQMHWHWWLRSRYYPTDIKYVLGLSCRADVFGVGFIRKQRRRLGHKGSETSPMMSRTAHTIFTHEISDSLLEKNRLRYLLQPTPRYSPSKPARHNIHSLNARSCCCYNISLISITQPPHSLPFFLPHPL